MADVRLFFRDGQVQRFFDEASDLLADLFRVRFGPDDANHLVVSVATVIQPSKSAVERVSTWEALAEAIHLAHVLLNGLKLFACSLLSLQAVCFLPQQTNTLGVAMVSRMWLAPFSLIEILFACFHEDIQFMEVHVGQNG
jgi:hypothetical protein